MPKGAVAAGHPKTAEAAAEILRAGGNAFDAVLAAACVACATEPVLCSPGGGGFLLTRDRYGTSSVFDFFVQTPLVKKPETDVNFYPIEADFGNITQEFHIGPGAIATPGLVKGIFEIHRTLGTMPIRDIVAPAIEVCRNGLTVNSLQAYIISVVSPIYQATPQAETLFSVSGSHQQNSHQANEPITTKNRLFREGDHYQFSELADAFELLAIEGDDLFYRGEIASLIHDMNVDAGYLTLDDLEKYQVIRRKPLKSSYRGISFLSSPPPSSGGLLISFALKLMEQLKLTKWGSENHLAQLIESMHLTNRARLEIDCKNDQVNNLDDLDACLLQLYQKKIMGRSAALRGTTHISVVDGEGNQAALTVSNGEGCGYIIPGTGIMLNNMLGEEDLNPGGFHQWTENCRMTSMMAPSILDFPNQKSVVLGSGGSNRIRSAILQVISNLVDFNMSLEEAIHSPRLHFENDKLSIENGFDQQTLNSLIGKVENHQLWDDVNLFFGGVHAVESGGRSLHGVGDRRRGGATITL